MGGDGVLIEDPLEILKATETTGSAFGLPGQVCQIALEDHAGGTWKLQYSRDKGVTWRDIKGSSSDTAYTWDSDAILTLWGSPQLRYRLTGGVVGAKAFAIAASVLNNEEAFAFDIFQAGS